MLSSGQSVELAKCNPGSFRVTWLGILCLLWLATVARCMTDDRIRSLREETQDLFYHGFLNYMKHAFPEDELRPITCAPLTRDRKNPHHIALNDVLGNYSLTLVDSLSTLAIFASTPPDYSKPNKALGHFQDSIELLVENYGDGTLGPSGQGKRVRGFDLDSKVQVFETVIRGVGGLLSAHLFAIGELPIRGYNPRVTKKGKKKGIVWPNGFVYDGQLLRLAQDLAERLLPAFDTPTGLPYPRVNLRYGIPFYPNSPHNAKASQGQCNAASNDKPEITETCSAGAGSLVLEFSTLSRLTGDTRFERAAKKAFMAVWNRRSSIGLIGAGIDAETGQWVSSYTGIGAGIDSFFEYAFKSHVLLSGLPSDQDEGTDSDIFLSVWEEAYAGIKRHIYRGSMYQHPHYTQVDLYTGATRAYWIDSLSAFYPGLLAFSGRVDEAIETHLLYTALWDRYSALPERWSTSSGTVESGLRWWGGRPEFIESAWYIYRATNDPWYLYVGEMVIEDIKRRCWTKCGWAGLQDVRTGEQTDRMESFFLGETAKYLFLLFDPSHPLNNLDSPFVFTTEGHPLIIPKNVRSSQLQNDKLWAKTSPEPTLKICPLPPSPLPFGMSVTAARKDVYHAANLARLHLMPTEETLNKPLTEFNIDHPSISDSELLSPSNYTYFPWTLPPELVPNNAMSAKMVMRTTFDLSFPNMPNTPLNFGSLQRVGDGILVNSMSGLRLGLMHETNSRHDGPPEKLFRIYSVSNIALGRDERVLVSRETISDLNPTDPYFTRMNDRQLFDLLIDAPLPSDPDGADTEEDSLGHVEAAFINATSQMFERELAEDGPLKFPPDQSNIASESSYLSSLLQSIQGLLSIPTASPAFPSDAPSILRHHIVAALPIGPGSAPLPDVEDHDFTFSENDLLPWTKIYLAGQLCDEKLTPNIPREYQVIIIQRGGCSFSTKLKNIPAYPPNLSSLQLVIVVSYPEHDGEDYKFVDSALPQTTESSHTSADSGSPQLIQPYLDMPQFSTTGLPRSHLIPLVLVGGGDETMSLFKRAKSIGVRRRWWVSCQGIRIGNLVIV